MVEDMLAAVQNRHQQTAHLRPADSHAATVLRA
jgi:hypothetical protein